jgi:hypothetical protein
MFISNTFALSENAFVKEYGRYVIGSLFFVLASSAIFGMHFIQVTIQPEVTMTYSTTLRSTKIENTSTTSTVTYERMCNIKIKAQNPITFFGSQETSHEFISACTSLAADQEQQVVESVKMFQPSRVLKKYVEFAPRQFIN